MRSPGPPPPLTVSRSPAHLLHEILLVDDASTADYLKQEYVTRDQDTMTVTSLQFGRPREPHPEVEAVEAGEQAGPGEDEDGGDQGGRG